MYSGLFNLRNQLLVFFVACMTVGWVTTATVNDFYYASL